MFFSVGDNRNPKVTLEINETFDEYGSWEIRTRDLDPESPSFGWVLYGKVKPDVDDLYHIHYEVRKGPNVKKVRVTSPLKGKITDLVPGLPDIGSPIDELGEIDQSLESNPIVGKINWRAGAEGVDALLGKFSENFQREPLVKWAKNVQVYERMGDFRDKCIHPGTNLTGPNPQLASEFVMIRSYRSSLIMLGRVMDPDMAKGSLSLVDMKNPLSIDTKPGVYTVFLTAYILNIGLHKLGIDKVHSDYGGIPMKLAPGSRLETGISPIVDATRANRTLAELAVAYYLSPKVAEPIFNLA